MVDQHALEIVFLVSKTLGGAAILLHLQYQTFCPCNQLELAKSLYLYHGLVTLIANHGRISEF